MVPHAHDTEMANSSSWRSEHAHLDCCLVSLSSGVAEEYAVRATVVHQPLRKLALKGGE